MAKKGGNPQNLNVIRSENEARIKGKNGGKKSGEVRAKVKSFREHFLKLLTEERRHELAQVLLAEIADNGNVKAFETVLAIIGETPETKSKVDLTNSDGSLQQLSVNLSASPAVQEFIARLKHNESTDAATS